MNNFLFDTHSHLDLVKDFDNVVSEIEQKKIYTIAVTNLPVLYKKMLHRINSKYIKPALGFHPELVGQYQKYISDMWAYLPEAKYIGEVGIDLKVSKTSGVIQTHFFEELIYRCNHLGGKILTIHSRGSADEVVKIIGDGFNGSFILHWYSGSTKTLERAVENGAYFSINYSMINSVSGQKLILRIPNDRLLIESDTPFVVVQNKVFDTLLVDEIVKGLANLKGIAYADMLTILCANFRKAIS
ncbi:TatD family hydrolase [Pedobacter sp. ASV1-7]|uniref:TatD family hydrolase n=1 Tax=Pedobacter sp. ASV1-7 TaxID=3145237 RepID=UPI0032E86ADF